MPQFMDIHRNVEGVTAEELIEAHRQDLEVQDEYGVNYTKYWFDEDEGAVFCLFEGPNKEAGERVHSESHGLTADEIYEVEEGE